MADDELAYWRAGLNGEWPRIPDEPQCGLYRFKQQDKWVPVNIWRDENPDANGEFCIRSNLRDDDIQAIWRKCATHPVSREMYDTWSKTGEWTDQLDCIGFEDLLPDDLEGRIIDLMADANRWYGSLAGLTTQSEADTAANYAILFNGLEIEIDGQMTHDLAPLKTEERRIRGRWTTLITHCAGMKRTIKDDWLGPWLRSHPHAMAGSLINGKRISIRKTIYLRVTSVRDFCRWIAERNEEDYPDYLVKALERYAQEIRDTKSTMPPGTSVAKKENIA